MIYAPQPGQKVKEAAVSGYKPDFAKRVLKENTNLVAGDVFYTTRIKGQGWTGESKNGTISGTIGKNTPLEALCVALKNGNVTGDVQYRTHVSNGYRGKLMVVYLVKQVKEWKLLRSNLQETWQNIIQLNIEAMFRI